MIRFHEVSKSYGEHKALDQVSFELPENKIIGMLGPNGAGKSTSIRMLCRIIQQDSGTIQWMGKNIDQKITSRIGYLPEERGLYKTLKIAEQLRFFGKMKGMSAYDSSEAARYWLDKFDLMDWRYKKADQLSKGMQQKVQFIAAVMHQPDLLILDEPFTGFDPINTQRIKDEILELQRKGTTIMLSTHRMEQVEEMCEYLVMIHKSQKVLEGEKHEVKQAFREGLYKLHHLEEIPALSAHYDILNTRKQPGEKYLVSELKAKEGVSGNEIVREISNHLDIILFSEKDPSMHEIFIKKTA
jgi:ABC-2 type transport system ATP-binding protein